MVGRGGMGVVYRARDQRLDREVALKLLARQAPGAEDFRQRFLAESKAAAAIDHPNILPVYDAGEIDGQLYISARFVHGPDLRALLRDEGPMDPGRAAAIVTQLASALDAAHARGLVHRDVKPANVLLDRAGGPDGGDHAYLADFGLTKLEGTRGLTRSGNFVGTPDYASPEQAAGREADARSDVYSLGCLLFECLTGAPPFSGIPEERVAWAQAHQPPPAPSTLRPALPGGLDEVLATALAKDPADRFQSCRALAVATRAAAGDPASQAPTTPAKGAAPTVLEGAGGGQRQPRRIAPAPTKPAPANSAPSQRRRRRAAWLAAAGLAAAAGISAAALAATGVIGSSEAGRTVTATQTAGSPTTQPHTVASAPAGTVSCGSFVAENPGGVRFRATDVTARNATCAEARQMIDSGPRGRAVAGWRCPVTGYKYFTACTRRRQRVAWNIPGGRSPSSGGGSEVADCGSMTTTNRAGEAEYVEHIEASGVGCADARSMIDSGPDGRASASWNCPITGNHFFTSCTRGSAKVSWSIPGGDEPSTQASASCGSFDSQNGYVTDIQATATGCDEARSMIDSGPGGRASAGWNCPVTGNDFYTSCTRGSQAVSWSIPGGDG